MKHHPIAAKWAKTAGLSLAILFGAASAATFAPVPVQAKSAVNVIYGYVEHVSSTNIKVYDINAKNSLGFEIFPKFDQLFSADGKTTYQMKDLKAGNFVKVYYDTKALGMRHADRIFVYHSNGTSPSRKE